MDQYIPNPGAAGSNPAGRTTFFNGRIKTAALEGRRFIGASVTDP